MDPRIGTPIVLVVVGGAAIYTTMAAVTTESLGVGLVALLLWALVIFFAWPEKKKDRVSHTVKSLPIIRPGESPPPSSPELEADMWEEIEPEEIPRPARYRPWPKPKQPDDPQPKPKDPP